MSGQRTAWWKRVSLRDVLFLTLPPFLLVLWLFGSAVMDYRRVRQYDDWWSNATSVRKFGWYRVRAALRLPWTVALEHDLSPEDAFRDPVRLRVDRREWDRIANDVGKHWGEWIEGELQRGGTFQKVELRFRGDGSAHWTSAKKSLTVKTEKREPYRGFRRLGFSVKDVLPQDAINSLAPGFGLLAPETAVVPLYLNDRFYGVFRFIEPIDESLLRRHGLFPGNVFRGDTAERGEYFKGQPRELFLNPAIWDRVAFNDRPGATGTAALGEFLRELNGTTHEDHRRLMARLDRDELSRLMALLLIAGDPYHMSGVHNQFWYEDPAAGTLHPILWDLRLLDLDAPPPGSNLNRFWRSVLRDPALMAGALAEIDRQLEQDLVYEKVRRRLEESWARHETALRYDQLRSGVIPPVGDVGEALATLRGNLERLREWVDDGRVNVHVGVAEGSGLVIDLSVSGRAPLTLRAAPGLPGSAELWRDSDLDGSWSESDTRVVLPAAATAHPLDEALLPGWGGSGAELVPAPLHYRYFLRSDDPAPDPRALKLEIVNALTDEPITPGEWPAGTPIAPGTSWHPWLEPAPVSSESRTSGLLHLTGDLRVRAGETWTVDAGTTLELAPDVSILAHGRVRFLGTAGDPITVRRSNPDLPWGVVALQGAGSAGSVFEHVRFLGGGGALLDGVEYKGMVCVHHSSRVRFEACEFTGNVRCDDALNVVSSLEVDVLSSHFHDTNADSIDYDLSTGTIRGCTIERSGNDGLDLMSCTPHIVSTVIRDSGDKGISIGEGSAPVIFDCEITGCERGLEVKDRSQPIVLHSRITGNRLGILQHNKNWRYARGGWAKLIGSVIEGNDVDHESADESRLTAAGSRLGEIGSAAGDTSWLLAKLGIAVEGSGPGRPSSWREAPRARELASLEFADGFRDPTAGWIAQPTVARLDQRDGDLVAHFERTGGGFARPIDWDPTTVEGRPVIVLELATENLAGLELTVFGRDTSNWTRIQPTPDPATYRYVTFEVPREPLEGLLLEAEPSALEAWLRLHSVRLFVLPEGDQR